MCDYSVVAAAIGNVTSSRDGLMPKLMYNYNSGYTDLSNNSVENQYTWNYVKLLSMRNIGVSGIISVTSHYSSAWAKRPAGLLPFVFRSYVSSGDNSFSFVVNKLITNEFISDIKFYYNVEGDTSTIYCSKSSLCSVSASILHSDVYWSNRAIVYNEKVDSLPEGSIEITY